MKFLKKSCKLMFKCDVYFQNIEVMISYIPEFKNKNNQKASTDCAERCWMLYVPM